MKTKFIFLILILFSFLKPIHALACDSCGCTLAKCAENVEKSQDQKLFFDFTFEQQQWKVKDAHDAHNLHHAGHEFHDKTNEEFYHFTAGVSPVENLTILAEIPYVVRGSLDVEHHATLGRKQTSEGIGDLNLFGIYKVLKRGDDFLGISGGVKFPVGDTTERDPYGTLFEPELQPGSGAWDYPVGIVYRYEARSIILSGNVSYIIKTEGAQDFRYGDLLFASLNADYILNPRSEVFTVKIGWDTTLHYAQQDRVLGVKDEDSGEVSLFTGPAIDIRANDYVSLFGNILFPAYQNTGGVHQKLSYLWAGGVKVCW